MQLHAQEPLFLIFYTIDSEIFLPANYKYFSRYFLQILHIFFVACKLPAIFLRGTQRQFSENICSEDDSRSRIFGTFVVKFLTCLPLLGFSNI